MELIEEKSNIQTQRRSWEVVIDSQLLYVPQINNEQCAVCHNGLEGVCITCESSNQNIENEYRQWCQDVLFTLLLCRKRDESPISKCDINVVARIYTYVIGSNKMIVKSCPVILLEPCNHRYHLHCWDRVTVKFGVRICPLHNTFVEDVSVDRTLNMALHHGIVMDCGVYKQSFEQRVQNRKKIERLDAQIMRVLKIDLKESRKNIGLRSEDIFEKVYAKDLKHVEETLNYLVRSEYVLYDTVHKTYRYY
jgi:hypothetical protein